MQNNHFTLMQGVDAADESRVHNDCKEKHIDTISFTYKMCIAVLHPLQCLLQRLYFLSSLFNLLSFFPCFFSKCIGLWHQVPLHFLFCFLIQVICFLHQSWHRTSISAVFFQRCQLFSNSFSSFLQHNPPSSHPLLLNMHHTFT